MDKERFKRVLKSPYFYLICLGAAVFLIIGVITVQRISPKSKEPGENEDTVARDELYLLPGDTLTAEPETADEAAPAQVTPKRNAPIPENYSKPLEKDTVSTAEPVYEKPAVKTPVKLINVLYINQLAGYPSGCESVSAVMALNYWGYDISVSRFIDNYLDKAVTPYIGTDGKYYGYDPREYFLGDPYSEKGWGCLAPVIVNALNRCIYPDIHKVENITGAELSSLRDYIDRDIPVIVWATQGMQKTRTSKTWTIVGTDNQYTWTAPNHCLLLVGYDETGYYFNDPLTHSNCRYSADIVENRYNAMGRQAIVILKTETGDTSEEYKTDDKAKPTTPEDSDTGEPATEPVDDMDIKNEQPD